MEYVCQICMEVFDEKGAGTECAEGHFLCDQCLNPFLTQNIFPNLFALKRNNCAVHCPVIGMIRHYTIHSLVGIHQDEYCVCLVLLWIYFRLFSHVLPGAVVWKNGGT